MVSQTLEPQEIDFEAEWIEFRKSLDNAFAGPSWPRADYQQQYSRVYRICTASPEPKSTELYANISNYLDEKSEEHAVILDQYDSQKLLEEYSVKWTSFQRATGDVNNVCRYLNKNHLNDRQYASVEANLMDGRGVDYALPIVHLANEKWRHKVIDKIDAKLVDACLTLIKKMRSGDPVSDSQKGQVHTAVKSFIDVCQHSNRTKLDLYQEKFESRLLQATSEFYNAEGRKFLEKGDVGAYISKVLGIIAEEDRRAFTLFDRSTMSKQKDKIVKSLIFDALEFLFEAAEIMVKMENAEQLQKLYKLFKDMEDPLARLVKMFKLYIEEIGIDKIKPVKTSRDFVDVVCSHYDNYKNFVDRVFVNEPEVEYRTPYDVFDEATKDIMQPDKNFLESLKDAMRTIVNYKENENDRPRAPEFLAQYADQILKRRAADEIQSKLDDIIKCLEFVAEKDIFQTNYSRRLAKRLIYGHSSSIDAERSMIERLKEVCLYEFTSKIKRMYDDIINSQFQMTEYHSRDDSFSGIDVKVLGKAAWPTMLYSKVAPTFTIPRELESAVQTFSAFYEEKHKDQRRLTWLYQMSHAEVRTLMTPKMHLLNVTTYQTAILLALNDRDQVSIKELYDLTELDTKEIQKQLRPMLEQELLRLVGDGELTEFSTIIVNDGFEKKGTKVKMTPNAQKESNLTEREKANVIHTVQEDRKYWLQACISRIMKRLRKATFAELYRDVQRESSGSFTPNVAFMHTTITCLIEKSFIEKANDSTDDAPIYLYIA